MVETNWASHALTLATILMTLLIVLSLPAAAQSTQVAVASQHTTDTDFNAANTLDSVSVQGSGSAASVTLDSPTYNVVIDDGDGVAESSRSLAGDNDANQHQSTEWQIQPDFTRSVDEIAVNIDSATGDNYDPAIEIYVVQERPDGTIGEGTLVRNGWNPDWSTGQKNIQLDSSFSVASGTNYTLEFVTTNSDGDGSFDLLNLGTDEDSGLTDWRADTNGNVNDGGGNISVFGPEVDSGRYISASHSAENVKRWKVNSTLENASLDVRGEYWDGSTWQVAASETYDSTANHTLDVSGHESRDTWRLNATFNNQTGETTAQLHDEAVLVEAQQPTTSGLSPSGDIDSRTVNLSATITDADFALAHGDEVTVEWYLDGSQVGSDTVTSNGTYDHEIANLTGGEHDWHVEVTDSFGLSETSATETFSVPGEIEIFEETNPDELVDSATVTLQFFGSNSDTVVERSTTDGSLNMTGLPVDEEMTIVAEADGYYTRRIYIESIFQQAQVYLLNESRTASAIVFALDDRTDQFPAEETVLTVEKPVQKDFTGDGDNETRYQVIAGDVFGASGEFPVDLEPDTRYRLRVDNRAGQERVLGAYTASGDSVETLTIGQVSFGEETEAGVSFQAQLVDFNSSRYVKVSYLDDEMATDELEFGIVRYDNESDVLQANETVSGPLGEYSETVNVPASEPDNVTYVVTWAATRDGAPDDGGSVNVGDVAAIAATFAIDPTVLEYASYVGIVALTGLVVIYDDKLAAVIAVLSAMGLTLLGAISVPPLALGIGGTIAVLYNVGRIR